MIHVLRFTQEYCTHYGVERKRGIRQGNSRSSAEDLLLTCYTVPVAKEKCVHWMSRRKCEIFPFKGKFPNTNKKSRFCVPSDSDLDECNTDVNTCSHTCNNYPGGFYCTCPDGSEPDDGENCQGRSQV